VSVYPPVAPLGWYTVVQAARRLAAATAARAARVLREVRACSFIVFLLGKKPNTTIQTST
jgi:hypothetical protein